MGIKFKSGNGTLKLFMILFKVLTRPVQAHSLAGGNVRTAQFLMLKIPLAVSEGWPESCGSNRPFRQAPAARHVSP
jgi:hypothetical protein